MPEPRQAPEQGHAHRPAHAATLPRLTGPHADTIDSIDTGPADTDQHAA